MPKHNISSCLWKCRHVFFLMMWHITAYGARIIVSDCFFFISFFSLSCQIKCTIVLFVFAFSISVLILLISYFILIPFIKSFVCFRFSHSIKISHMFFFSFRSPFFMAFLLKFYWLSILSFNQSFLFFFFQFQSSFF